MGIGNALQFPWLTAFDRVLSWWNDAATEVLNARNSILQIYKYFSVSIPEIWYSIFFNTKSQNSSNSQEINFSNLGFYVQN